MSDTAVVENAASSPVAVPAAEKKAKKVTATKAKKPSTVPSHPPTQQMVDAAIKTLKERGGSSLAAIKKYMAGTYKVDAQKLAPFIKKYLKSAVESGKLIQTKGKGATGSFKLSAAASKEPKEKKPAAEKKKVAAAASEKKKKSAAAAKKKTASPAKKPSAAKKTAEKKKTEKASAKTAKKTGTVKAKPAKKAPATKPKAPKAKTAAAAKPKKASSPVKKPAAKKAAGKK